MTDFNRIYGQDPNAKNKEILREMKTRARMLLQEENFNEVLTIAAELCEKAPHDADNWHMRAIASNGTGQFQNAEKYSRQALTITPAHAGAALALANSLNKQGNNNAAITTYQNALIHHPDQVEVLNNLGSLLRQSGRLDEAENHLEKAHSLRPKGPYILNNLGLLCRDRGNLTEAIKYYRESLAESPDYIDAHFNLASALLQLGNLPDSETHYRKAIELNSQFLLAYRGLATLLTSQGKTDEALLVLEEARRIAPDDKDIAAALADTFEKQGNSAQALGILEPLLAEDSITPQVAYSFARIAPAIGRQQEAIGILSRQLESHELPYLVERELYFSRGNLHDSARQYELAFADIEHARSLGDASHAVLVSLQLANLVMQGLSPGKAAVTASISSDLPVFLVGMPDSGATMVEKILAAHSQIESAGVFRGMGQTLNTIPARCGTGSSYPSCISTLDESALNDISQEYQQKLLAGHASARRILDCNLQNFLHLEFISRVFPGSRVIHCTRNPLDASLAIYFSNYLPNSPYAGNMEDLANIYKSYQQVMQHWKTTLDISVLDISYEEMAVRHEPLIGELLDFCGMDQEQACLDVFSSDKESSCNTGILYHSQARSDSIDYWKHYEKFIGPLIQALG